MRAPESILAAALLYTACVIFFQAGARRSGLDAVRRSAVVRNVSRAIAWAAVLAALWLCAEPQGWERGIPVWLGLFSLAGGLSLVVSALNVRVQALTGLGAAVVAGTVFLMRTIGSGLT